MLFDVASRLPDRPAVSDDRSSRTSGTTEQTEQVIPVVKEELAVGKTASERRYRIRTYVVETPVEEQVKLRDERVIVERRPASGTVGSDAGAMQERVFEVTERHEEPVVEKRAREAEEVVVRKEADERVETVPCARPRWTWTRGRQIVGRTAEVPPRLTAIRNRAIGGCPMRPPSSH